MRKQIYYTESKALLMWDRWRQGGSSQQIAQLFERNHSSVQRILGLSGGIRPGFSFDQKHGGMRSEAAINQLARQTVAT